MSKWRGHAIELRAGAWVYVDTQKLVSDDPDRTCGHCGIANTVEGHDACLGTLPDTLNACCGHGVEAEAYIQLTTGILLSGAEARQLQLQELPSSKV